MAAAGGRWAGGWQAAAWPLQEADDRPDDFGRTVGDDIRPALGMVVRKNVYLRARKLCGCASTRLGAQTRFPSDHEEARRDVRKRPRVEPCRYAKHNAGDSLGELRRKISNVAQDLCGEACCVELKVLHQRGETLNCLHSSLPSHRPTRRVDTQLSKARVRTGLASRAEQASGSASSRARGRERNAINSSRTSLSIAGAFMESLFRERNLSLMAYLCR